VNNRDQRASKEISRAELSAIRARIYHPPGTPAYENCTLLVMQFTASAGLSAASNRRIKVDCTRKLYDPGAFQTYATSNPALMAYDAYTNTEYGAGRPATEFDRPNYMRLAPQWDAVGFNGVFDQPTTLIEALQAVLTPVRAMPLPIGSTLSVAQDAPRSRAYVFGPETICDGSTAIGYNFDGMDQPDCLEVIYTDPDTFADARVYYPSKGVNPETVELFGCTSQAHASNWAKLRWQEQFYNRKTARFELEGEGYLLQPLTRFGLTVPALDWGTGGIVENYNATERLVSLDTPIPDNAGAVIYFKAEDGTLGNPVAFTRQTDRVIRLGSTPTVTIKHGDQSGDGTRWVLANATEQFFEFSVVNLEAAGPMRVRVTGQQYTAAKYVGTFLENWTP
jgi:predicted phage tail protein